MADEFTNITVTKELASGTTAVEIGITKDEEILNKIITKITPPQSSNNWDSGPKDTLIVDLLRLEQWINIDGDLITDTTSSSSVKKKALKAAVKAGGVVTLTYDGEPVTGSIEKISFSKIVSDGMEPTDGEVGYTVKFTFIRGIDL